MRITIGAFACSGFSRLKSISVAKNLTVLLKSATEKHDPKMHLSLLVCDKKHANKIPQRKVLV